MEQRQESFFGKYKWYLIILGVMVFYMISKNNTPSSSNTGDTVYIESTVQEPTEGVITKVKEVEPEIFKITEEEVVATKDDSRIIATYLDGGVDTFQLQEIAVIDTTLQSEDSHYRRRSGISTAVHYGLLGYWLGRPMGSGIRQSSYANSDAYNRSQNGRTRMNSSATRKTVRTPRPSSTGKSGFGSGKSTRSYGG
ncbi:hypothetical protein [Portibacter lacus]|uniref:UPF0323 domain-containing protein n=1 Tax=Portibacter lacus TaxID=1099794 RepID=A0AA37WF44_9BACT|nr:hypothetical protein [Portibacter lacus]GLR16620.1 hypothetical protein GCM10007940_12350 [Portibacter lacus]